MDARDLMNRTIRWALKLGLDDEQTSRAVCLAWYEASKFEEAHGWTYPASHWARIAVKKALQGRDVPGVQPGKKQDALDFALQGCGMGELMDRRPGPEKEAADREMIERWWARLTARERLVLRLLDTGMQKRQVARTLGVVSSRLSQILQRIVEKAE